MAVKRDPESGETIGHKPAGVLRGWIAKGFTAVEDVVYIGLGLLLTGTAFALLIAGAVGFGRSVLAGESPHSFVGVLDQILLVLLVIELLYTVKVSFREHSLVPEPFLIVGLIAVTRRILVITAELSTLLEKGDESVFRHAMLELGLLTAMVVAFVGSLLMLRR
ncbi:MAG: phosphate-starvation-inducible PsiE family protein, partial [Acidobacteriota bacterium]